MSLHDFQAIGHFWLKLIFVTCLKICLVKKIINFFANFSFKRNLIQIQRIEFSAEFLLRYGNSLEITAIGKLSKSTHRPYVREDERFYSARLGKHVEINM